ncbi:MAG: type II toxin-antitoxin system Phd/YefM family antitoxin [Bacteroidota bacterium]
MVFRKITANQFTSKMDGILDDLYDGQRILIVERADKAPIVVMTLSEYESMVETEYLLSSNENRKVMAKAMKELANDRTENFDLPD